MLTLKLVGLLIAIAIAAIAGVLLVGVSRLEKEIEKEIRGPAEK
jgi:hypothetical protein